MIRKVRLNSQVYEVSKDAKELYHVDSNHFTNCNIALDMINDALDYIWFDEKRFSGSIFAASLSYEKRGLEYFCQVIIR